MFLNFLFLYSSSTSSLNIPIFKKIKIPRNESIDADGEKGVGSGGREATSGLSHSMDLEIIV